MNEFIEKLIGRLKELQKINYEAYEIARWNNDKIMYINASNAYANAITEVNQLAEKYNNGWIDCCERLPEHRQTVIFLTEEGMVEAGYYDVNEDWCVNDSYFPNAFRFVAWQPLPEPYKEKQ